MCVLNQWQMSQTFGKLSSIIRDELRSKMIEKEFFYECEVIQGAQEPKTFFRRFTRMLKRIKSSLTQFFRLSIFKGTYMCFSLHAPEMR